MVNKSVVLCIIVLCFSQCGLVYRTSVPIRTVYHQSCRTPGTETLVVFLPGRQSTPEDFSKEGFISILQSSKSAVDSVAVDAHLGYYIHRNLLERLRHDVIMPAKKNGYKKVWIVGTSIGGIGALLYNEKHHDTINGVMVLAPFLGDEDVIDEIYSAGGALRWEPVYIGNDDYQRKLWLWLKNYARSDNSLPVMLIGYGKDDRFARPDKLLADILPEKQVHTVAGGHDWKAWKQIFIYFVNQNVFNN